MVPEALESGGWESRWVLGCPHCAHTLDPFSLINSGIGTLTKFTLVLYGTASEGLSTPPESSGCKTLTSSQACVGQ